MAEYNYWCDPEAAKICYELFAEAGKKIEMVGLDVTRKIVLTPNLISYMSVWIRRPADLSGRLPDFTWISTGNTRELSAAVINDPLAVAYLIDPSMCSGFDSFLEVETEGICRGQTVVDSMNFWKKKPTAMC